MTWFGYVFVAGIIGSITTADAATVDVIVQGIRNDHGHVRVALCNRSEFLHQHCQWQASAPATPGSVAVRIGDVPPGTYAVQAFHDENDNQRLDRTWFGLPREGMGFSNDAPMHFGPPGFYAAAFTVGKMGADIRFSVRYF